MKVIIAPNALKNSLSAIEAAETIRSGINKFDSDVETICVPIADGGDGLLQVVKHALHGEWRTKTVEGPLGKPVEASFLYCPEKKLAVIELASAAGLALLDKQEYDIRNASTYGVGQLIVAALDLDIDHLILGIGGSATNDAAMGIASALGVRFLDDAGNELKASANNLVKIRDINFSALNKKIKTVKFDVICDVSNPLLGEHGAAAVFGPQKGANLKDVAFLENALAHFADVIQKHCHMNICNIEGGGAAGGVGAGLKALFNASLRKGAELVLDLLSFEAMTEDADLLITAEGKLDSQSAFGKAPYVAAEKAKQYHIPAYIIAGQAEEDCRDMTVFDGIYTLASKEISSEYAILHAAELMEKSTMQLMLDLRNTTKHKNHDQP